MHCLCASISLVQFSSPFSTILLRERGDNFSCCVTYCLCLFLSLPFSLSHLPCITCALGLGTGTACLALGFVTGGGCIRSCCCCCRRRNCLNDGDSFRCCAPHFYCCSRLSYDWWHKKQCGVIRLAVGTFAFVGILFM